MTVWCAGAGFDTWPGQDPYEPGSLPSDAGVDLTVADVHYRWEIPGIGAPGPDAFWRVRVDAEAIGAEARIDAPIVTFHDGNVTDGTVIGTPMTIRERAVYTSVGSDFDTIGGARDVVGFTLLTGELRIFSMCWEPATVAARPLRQTGRTDGLLGAPRQHRTSVRQLAGMR